jgi:hypothetical protein
MPQKQATKLVLVGQLVDPRHECESVVVVELDAELALEARHFPRHCWKYRQ